MRLLLVILTIEFFCPAAGIKCWEGSLIKNLYEYALSFKTVENEEFCQGTLSILFNETNDPSFNFTFAPLARKDVHEDLNIYGLDAQNELFITMITVLEQANIQLHFFFKCDLCLSNTTVTESSIMHTMQNYQGNLTENQKETLLNVIPLLCFPNMTSDVVEINDFSYANCTSAELSANATNSTETSTTITASSNETTSSTETTYFLNSTETIISNSSSSENSSVSTNEVPTTVSNAKLIKCWSGYLIKNKEYTLSFTTMANEEFCGGIIDISFDEENRGSFTFEFGPKARLHLLREFRNVTHSSPTYQLENAWFSFNDEVVAQIFCNFDFCISDREGLAEAVLNATVHEVVKPDLAERERKQVIDAIPLICFPNMTSEVLEINDFKYTDCSAVFPPLTTTIASSTGGTRTTSFPNSTEAEFSNSSSFSNSSEVSTTVTNTKLIKCWNGSLAKNEDYSFSFITVENEEFCHGIISINADQANETSFNFTFGPLAREDLREDLVDSFEFHMSKKSFVTYIPDDKFELHFFCRFDLCTSDTIMMKGSIIQTMQDYKDTLKDSQREAILNVIPLLCFPNMTSDVLVINDFIYTNCSDPLELSTTGSASNETTPIAVVTTSFPNSTETIISNNSSNVPVESSRSASTSTSAGITSDSRVASTAAPSSTSGTSGSALDSTTSSILETSRWAANSSVVSTTTTESSTSEASESTSRSSRYVKTRNNTGTINGKIGIRYDHHRHAPRNTTGPSAKEESGGFAWYWYIVIIAAGLAAIILGVVFIYFQFIRKKNDKEKPFEDVIVKAKRKSAEKEKKKSVEKEKKRKSDETQQSNENPLKMTEKSSAEPAKNSSQSVSQSVVDNPPVMVDAAVVATDSVSQISQLSTVSTRRSVSIQAIPQLNITPSNTF